MSYTFPPMSVLVAAKRMQRESATCITVSQVQLKAAHLICWKLCIRYLTEEARVLKLELDSHDSAKCHHGPDVRVCRGWGSIEMNNMI
jgi:hypothetical protein